MFLTLFASVLTFPIVLPDPVELTLLVAVPKGTPASEVVHIAGNADALGAWAADGMQLTRQADGRFKGIVSVPPGTRIEFKCTLGSWESVEKSASGADIPNRVLVATESATHEFTVERWAHAGPVSTLTGDIRFHKAFKSKVLDNERTLAIYLPPGYDTAKDQRYPVLYMHDGQNLFDAGSSFIGVEWRVDETVERLIKAGKIPPLIVVGIYNNADRMNEYTPSPDAARKSGGKGDAYTRFVIDEVKPFIDKTYRTKPGRDHTAVAGSSLGGLISLHMAVERPEVFSKCGVISPALMWDAAALLKRIEASPTPLKRVKVWLDMGTKEGDTLATFRTALDHSRKLADLLKKSGLQDGTDYKYMEAEGAVHNEGAWAERFDQVLIFFYGRSK